MQLFQFHSSKYGSAVCVQGEETKTTEEREPIHLVLQLDCSGSMNTWINECHLSRWQVVQHSVRYMLTERSRTGHKDDRVTLIMFATTAKAICTFEPLIFVMERLDELSSGEHHPDSGMTNIQAGNVCVFQTLLSPSTSPMRTIEISFTDGFVNTGEQRPEALGQQKSEQYAALQKSRGFHPTLFTFAISDNADFRIPRELARAIGSDGASARLIRDHEMRELSMSFAAIIGFANVTSSYSWQMEDGPQERMVTDVSMMSHHLGYRKFVDNQRTLISDGIVRLILLASTPALPLDESELDFIDLVDCMQMVEEFGCYECLPALQDALQQSRRRLSFEEDDDMMENMEFPTLLRTFTESVSRQVSQDAGERFDILVSAAEQFDPLPPLCRLIEPELVRS